MSMIIQDFGTLQMARSDEQHFGQSKIHALKSGVTEIDSVSSVKNFRNNQESSSVKEASDRKSFQEYLLDAVNTVNTQQLDVTRLQEKVITSPDEVDIHDVTIAMSKARMSLNLAQSVIDRMVTGWNEITTTR